MAFQPDFSKASRRHDLTDLYFFEGTIYVSMANEIKQRNSFYYDKTLAYVVPNWKSFEVDEYRSDYEKY